MSAFRKSRAAVPGVKPGYIGSKPQALDPARYPCAANAPDRLAQENAEIDRARDRRERWRQREAEAAATEFMRGEQR